MRRLIVTADDFGMSEPVNEAVERAHRDGILGAASLMVGAPAAADAVARARRLPGLAVGLHVVVTRGVPVLPAVAVPALAGADGRFRHDLFAAGVAYAFSAAARRQLEAEMRAQFAAFAATGLRLDHADVHNHMQAHPVVFALLTRVGREFGLPAIRVPHEPFPLGWRLAGRGGLVGRALGATALRPWAAVQRRRLRAAGMACNDALLGMADTGRVDADLLERFIRGLPGGVTEIHLHPATAAWDDPDPAADPAARKAEFEALVAARVRRAVAESGAVATTYGALAEVA